MPINLAWMPNAKKGLQEIADAEAGIDLSRLPHKNEDLLRTRYRTDPTTPETEAKVYDVAKRTQLPSQTVRSNLPKAQQLANEPDWETLQREAPTLAAKLRENPDLFRVAKSSVDELSTFAKLTKVLGAEGLAEIAFRAPEMARRTLLAVNDKTNPLQQLYRMSVLDNPAYADLKAQGRLPQEVSAFVLNNPLMEQLSRPVEFSTTIADAIREKIDIESQSTGVGKAIADAGRRANEATMAALNGDFEPMGELLSDPSAMSLLVGQGFASLMAALGSRGSIVPIMFMEAGETASEIATLEKETGVKISDDDYLLAVTMKALFGGYLERVGAGGFAFDKASGALSALMRILTSTAGEAGTEFGQALTGNVAKLLTYDEDANPAEDVVGSTIAGFGLGLGVQSTTEAGYGTKALVDASMQKKFVERQKKVIKADQSSAVIKELMARARDAKLRELSPDAFEEVVEAQVADTELAEVYFDSQDLADHYAQQDMSIDDALADMPDVLQQWYEVEATGGGDVVVPLQKVTRHLLDRPEDAGLENHVRFNADDLSQMEADSYRQTDAQDEFAEEADRILKEKSEDELFVASSKAVEDKAFEALETANRFNSDVNRTYAKIVGNFYTVYAGRLGTTPEEMAKRYPLPINAVTARGPQISFDQLSDDAFEVDTSADGSQFVIRGDRDGADVARMELIQRDDNRLQIKNVNVDVGARGERVGQQLIEQAYQLAQQQGRELVSDVAVSVLQLRAYEALRRRGWTIEYSDPEKVKDMMDLASEAEAKGREISSLGVAALGDENGPSVVSKIEAPKTKTATAPERPFEPLPAAQEAARKYAESAGLVYEGQLEYQPLDATRGKRIADEFDAMEHDPDNPEVQAAYRAMMEETAAQYEVILETGLEIEFITGEDPYTSPHDAVRDVHENNHLYVFSTRDGFGSDETFDASQNPLLEETQYEISGQPALANDLFRVVHDYFGHIKDGNGFRALGEDNAWQSHAPMYSPLARRAMTVETRGQNSWVNFGPHAEFNRTASGADTVYADQKLGLLPIWVSEEGRVNGKQRDSETNDKRVRPSVRDDGRIELTHYTRAKGIERVDPRKQRNIHGEGNRRNRIPRSYYGIAPGTENGYRVEGFLRGATPVTTSVAAELLYDGEADPDNLHDPDNDMNVTEQNVRDAGYSGFWLNHPQHGLLAVVFDPLPVEQTEGNYFQDDRQLAPLNRAQKNNIGLFSAVEQAVIDMKLQGWNAKQARKNFTEEDEKRLLELKASGEEANATKIRKLELRKRAKEVGGLASGKEIWQKVSKMPGVKTEELETLGLEAFLLAGEKFSRDDVIQFVRNNGVEIEEIVGSTDPDAVDEDEVTWNEEIDEDSENWQHRVEDYIYDFERTDFVSEFDSAENLDTHWIFDHREWIENNYEDILDALNLQDKRIPGQEDFMVGGEGDIGQADDIQTLLLTAIEYQDELGIPDVEDTVRKLMRSDFEEAAEQGAEREYMDSPYYIVTSPELPNTYITGSDDVGWSIDGEYGDIYSLEEAQIQAIGAARENGDLNFSSDETTAQWADHVIDNADVEDTYRELKLTLPNNPGPEFVESNHFQDPNIVAFMRVTDRHLTLDDEPLQVTPKIHHQEESGQLMIGGNRRYLTAGYYIFDEFEDGTIWNFSTRFADRETAERRIQYWNTQSRKPIYHSYFVDESQSDWHQTAQQSGYTDPDFNRSEAVDKRARLETLVNNDLEAVYQRLSNMNDTDAMSQYGVFFESGAMVVPVQRGDNLSESGESVGAHAFVQYAWNILGNSPAAQSALADDQVMPTGLNQVASYRYISGILDAELNDNDRRVLETFVKEYDEVDATIQRDVDSVPDAPFKGNAWVELSVRRAIVDAVENGYHAFGWADTGMVIDRWNDHYAVGYESHYNEKWVSIVKKVTGQTPKHFTWEDGEPIPPPVKPTITVKQLTEEDVRNETVSASVRNTFRPGRWYWELEWPADEDGNQRFRSSMTATGGQFETEKDARKAAKRDAIIDYTDDIGYWAVPLTQEFKDKIRAEGLPLFQDQTRGLFTPETSTITLLENANLSTFLHEFGHFQLEVMADLASQHGTPKEIKQDMQTILDWFGVENVNAWNRMTLEEKRTHHEKFARGFEKYLYTGKAPNSQLSDIFARIREWMISVYKSIRDLNVTLTPEVTEVFDRLVATEAQIKEAEELQGYRQLFKSEEESGMTPAEWRAYQDEAEKPSEDARRDLQNRALRDMQWLRNARSRELKKLQAKAKDKRAAIREEVEAEVMAEPIQQAIQFLKTGELEGPAAEEIKVEKGHRLANKALEEMYPKDALGNRDWRALPTGRYGLRGKDGLHPDMVAGVFGFESGDDLVAELLAAEKASDKIEGITDTRMLEQYGELSSPEALEAAVDAAIHNEARSKLIATELVALEQATGKKRSLLRAAKQYAKDVIGNMEVRNVRKANRFAVTERKAAREAELALRRGDRELAAKHRRSQLVANLMYREALNAKDEVPKMLRLFNKFQKPGVRKNLDQEYLDQIDQLLERYDLRSQISQHQIDRRISLNKWVEDQIEQTGGVEPAIDPRLLNEAARTHYSRLTLNEMRGLYDSIRSIEHIARWKKKLLTAKDKREFKARMDEVVTSIENNATKVVKERMENNGPLDKAADGWHEWFAMHRKLGSIVRVMDGLRDGGPVWELLLRPANERADYETVEHEKATEALNDILKPVYSQGRMNKKIDIPGTDKRVSVEGRFVMLLNMGNETNLDRLMEGELGNGWTEADFEAVKNSASKEEWDAVQGVWDFINSYWPQIAAKQARVTGVAPEKVEAQEIQTPHGTYRGGYFPIKYNAKRSRQSDANTANELLEQKRKGNYGAATTRRGHTKERGKSGTGPLRYDMGVITEHVSDVIHDLAWHEWALDANRIVRDKGFEKTVRKHYGDPIVKLLTHAVEDIVIGDVPAKNMFERVINHLRIGSTIVGLGYSVFTAALQPFGLAQSMVRIGPQHVLRGMGRWLASPRNMEDSVGWIFENSDFMRLRNKTMMREMDEVLNQVRGEKLTKVKASFFVLIAKAQMIADVPTWVGQYHKSMEVTGGDHAKSVALADQAVKDSQGSGLGMDRAEIQRGGPLLKIFTNFYSYFNATFNLLAESKSQTNFRKPKEVGLFVVDFMLLTILPATLAAISREAIYQLTGGDDEEDKDGAEIAIWLARENLSYLSGLMVGAREVSGALQGYYGYTGPAGLRFFGEFGKLMGQTGQGEVDEAFLKSLNQVAGLVFHYPAAQVERTAEGMIELAEGESSNPAVLLTGTE